MLFSPVNIDRRWLRINITVLINPIAGYLLSLISTGQQR